MGDDDDLSVNLSKWMGAATTMAEMTRAQYLAYTSVGFTEAQAMTLTLAWMRDLARGRGGDADAGGAD